MLGTLARATVHPPAAATPEAAVNGPVEYLTVVATVCVAVAGACPNAGIKSKNNGDNKVKAMNVIVITEILPTNK